MPGLTGAEMASLREGLGREPSPAEVRLAEAEWSEHCSYKSSKRHLAVLPRDGPHVVGGGSYDSGVIDAGGGYVVTIHIESHNHPSAVEPYGGAATGVGGVVRDILSAGTRPIAVLDGLRFGDPRGDPGARWLLKRAVEGIADYGNCIGVPTVGGEVGFDPSYNGYALVDVAAVGFGRRESLVPNRASGRDVVHIVGGATGRDGIGGAGFASGSLGGGRDGLRSAVQIPDPFTEKLVIEAVLAARSEGIIRAMKDLGGGGLACAVSETADSLGVGIDIDIGAVHTRDGAMGDADVLVSESQERMLVVTSRGDSARLAGICEILGVQCSAIGAVTRRHRRVRVRGRDGSRIVDMPASLAAHAPLVDRAAQRPAGGRGGAATAAAAPARSGGAGGLSAGLERLLASPNVASKAWAYGQYDHEVGIRTVVGPGRDAAVLRLDNGRFLAVSMDGNPRHCGADPAAGAAGCFEEACRNVACAGARPAGMVDHLQFGDPSDPGVFWAFLESLNAIAAHARASRIPCVGGKVSFYNEAAAGAIRPTPLIAVAGLADAAPPRRWGPPLRPGGDAAAGAAPPAPRPAGGAAHAGALLFAVGATYAEETAAAEYAQVAGPEWAGAERGAVPRVRPAESAAAMDAVIGAVSGGLADIAHDCSKGGIAVAAAELCLWGGIGCTVDLDRAPVAPASARGADAAAAGGGPAADAALLFSESHSRYLMAASEKGAPALRRHLSASGARWAEVGRFGGPSVRFVRGGSRGRGRAAASIALGKARAAWTSWRPDGRGAGGAGGGGGGGGGA